MQKRSKSKIDKINKRNSENKMKQENKKMVERKKWKIGGVSEERVRDESKIDIGEVRWKYRERERKIMREKE